MASNNYFPFSALRSLKATVISSVSKAQSPRSRFGFDQNGRLALDDQKSAVPCPRQTERTAVLLILGQSNTGNHGGQRFRSEHGEKVVNFFETQCFLAESPLLGSDGVNGEYWTHLGNLLIDAGEYDQVVLAPVSISGSEISRWAQGGDINPLVRATAAQLLHSHFQVTHVLFHQGEIDYVIGTSEADYRERFLSLVDSLRSENITAPIFISIASKCLEASNGGTRFHSENNPIVHAQLALPNEEKAIKLGVNTDTLLDRIDRFDDCHFSGSGGDKAAKAWVGLLRKVAPKNDAYATGAIPVDSGGQ